ncbi:MAG TPA: hypothetical protein VFU43_12825 [Streptosporangiaceae bacterium]|nr:hypothetical protein [Streptosporangiaceae bacterium]
MKIPKPVNAILDWMGHNVRAVAAVGAALIISIVVWRWVPLASMFVLGVAIGGGAVHQRMASRQAALRSDIDDLLRQNGALRREKLTLASGVIAKQAQLTAKLPVISDDPDAAEPAVEPVAEEPMVERPVVEPPAGPAGSTRTDAVARTDPTARTNPAKRTNPLPQVDHPVVPPDPVAPPEAAGETGSAAKADSGARATPEQSKSTSKRAARSGRTTRGGSGSKGDSGSGADPSRTRREARGKPRADGADPGAKPTARLPIVPDDSDV